VNKPEKMTMSKNESYIKKEGCTEENNNEGQKSMKQHA